MIKITDKEFVYLVDFAKRNFGVNLEKKRTLVESRLTNYFVKNSVETFSQYFEILKNDITQNEMTQFINILTTNYSYFMREEEHFKYLYSNVLPQIKEKISDYDLRTWCAGCSSGQEAYTLAMLYKDFFLNDKKPWDYKVLATDISQKALSKAVAGEYNSEEIEDIPAKWKLNYFEKQRDSNYIIRNNIKEQVIYRKFNLMQEVFPFKKKFHVIFCRNVMIYFDKETKNNLVQKFYDCTEPGGYLFVGQSEAINVSQMPYDYVMPSIYKKV